MEGSSNAFSSEPMRMNAVDCHFVDKRWALGRKKEGMHQYSSARKATYIYRSHKMIITSVHAIFCLDDDVQRVKGGRGGERLLHGSLRRGMCHSKSCTPSRGNSQGRESKRMSSRCDCLERQVGRRLGKSLLILVTNH